MVHAKEVLVNQLIANANDRSWYASFEESVEGLSEEDAFWKPDNESHSIAQITQHLIYWNEVWQTRFLKNDFQAVESLSDNADTFKIAKDKTFIELKETLLSFMLDWGNLITQDKLDSNVTGFPVEAAWWALIGNASTHNAYHIGQINYIRKMKKHDNSN